MVKTRSGRCYSCVFEFETVRDALPDNRLEGYTKRYREGGNNSDGSEPRSRRRTAGTPKDDQDAKLRLQSHYITEDSYVFAFADTSYTASLEEMSRQLGFKLVKLYSSLGWPRDEILVGSGVERGGNGNGRRLSIFVPEPEKKQVLQKVKSVLYAQKTAEINRCWKKKGPKPASFLQKISGVMGGSAVFENSEEVKRKYFAELQPKRKQEEAEKGVKPAEDIRIVNFRFPIEGGQVIHQNGYIFVGQDSKTLFERINPGSSFETEFRDRFLVQPVMVPNIMWHLDLFWLVVKNNVAVLPLLDAKKVHRRRKEFFSKRGEGHVPFTPVDSHFFTVMTCFQKNLNDLADILAEKGIKVYFLDGFFAGGELNKPVFNAVFFNGLSGLATGEQPYVILPSFGHELNVYFTEQLLEVEPGLGVFFAGEPLMNTEQLQVHGGVLRCATAH